MITKIVEFQCGVDILGFPIYHQHIFFQSEKTDVNIFKKKQLVNGIIQKTVKQH